MVDPLKCNIICLECMGGDAEGVGSCRDDYCPMNGSRVSDKKLRSENPVFGEPIGRQALNKTREPKAIDHNYHPLYTVTVTEGIKK